MYHDGEDVFYYVTRLQRELRAAARSPTGVDEGIIRGIYRLDAAPDVDDAKGRVRLVGSGSILQQVLAARDLLANELGIAAEVYSATSFQQLRHEALQVERWNRLHPDKTPRVPYVSQVLGPDGGPIVVATDWVRTLPDLVAPWVPDPYIVLGTDGFGRSDTRESLRAHFEIDPPHIAAAALAGLARCGSIDARQAAKSIRALGVDPGDVRPADPLTRPTDAATAGSATTGALPARVPQRAPHGTAREVFAATLRLGLTSFGGPIAHLGYQRRAFVDERGWLDDAAFAELAALCQTLPGPGQQPADDRGRSPARRLGRGASPPGSGSRCPSALIMIVARAGRGRRARARDRPPRGRHPRPRGRGGRDRDPGAGRRWSARSRRTCARRLIAVAATPIVLVAPSPTRAGDRDRHRRRHRTARARGTARGPRRRMGRTRLDSGRTRVAVPRPWCSRLRSS